ncbi:hypothetical protein JCGZ_06434 [Jatropha curcas]|uniref:Uncharacterized protein n=1 Tax=Jatropha curcas TaxID=180498 RepID=A0A067KS18_JATCU|nr:hypothetical protein JCGZ_06434 [Jatropha curcas]
MALLLSTVLAWTKTERNGAGGATATAIDSEVAREETRSCRCSCSFSPEMKTQGREGNKERKKEERGGGGGGGGGSVLVVLRGWSGGTGMGKGRVRHALDIEGEELLDGLDRFGSIPV